MRLNPQISGMATNGQYSPNFQIPGQVGWAVHPPFMGYMEHPSGYFPNYCYPYPPPPPPPPPPHFASYGPVYVGMQPMYVPMMGVSYFVPDQYEQAPDMAMSRASLRSRNARRRVLENEEHTADHKPANCMQVRKQENGYPSVASAGQRMQALDSKDLMFLLAKQLSPSGVNSLGRIVLPKKEAEAHLPHLVASEGLLLTMADFDTNQSWTFRYRFWSNNKSRMYLLENTRDFVRAHNLQERDMLVLYKDAEGRYVVRGEKNGTNPQTVDNKGDIAPAGEVTTTEEEIARREQTVEFLI